MQEYGNRMKKLPAPPTVVWDDLTAPKSEGTRAWLGLLPDEVRPKVLEASKPSRVVWTSLWTSRPNDRIVLDLTPDGSDTALRFTLLADGEPPDASKTEQIRKRMSQLLFAELRYSYGS